MCCYVDQLVKPSFSEGKCIAYKVVLRRNDCYLSIYRNKRYHLGVIAQSSRQNQKLGEYEIHHKCVNYGIHVFLNYEDARKDTMVPEVVIKVECTEQDFVAAGHDSGWNADSAVFMNVLPLEEIQ